MQLQNDCKRSKKMVNEVLQGNWKPRLTEQIQVLTVLCGQSIVPVAPARLLQAPTDIKRPAGSTPIRGSMIDITEVKLKWRHPTTKDWRKQCQRKTLPQLSETVADFSSKNNEGKQYRTAGENNCRDTIRLCTKWEMGGSANNKTPQTKMKSCAEQIVPPAERQIDLLPLHFGSIYCIGCTSREQL